MKKPFIVLPNAYKSSKFIKTPFFSNRKILLSFIFAFFTVFSFFATKNLSITSASIAGFDPGLIMSDQVMSNKNSMSEADIQKFLKSKNHCNNRDINLASYYSHLHYNIRDGHFVCMADDSFDGESAAHIIWQAAQDYNINPQVILVLLEKEQGLISDTWPNNIQYRSATGFGCPDTDVCNAKYYGLKNQIRQAAALFREVLDGGWTNYPLGNTYVKYNPDSSCGGSYVNIRSLATSALYRYTPYQPNAAALAAHPGSAHCGAYGNRNFYSFFTDWFGSTQTQVITPAVDLEKLKAENTYVPNGTYSILTPAGKALDIPGGSKESGVRIQLYNSNKTNAQKFNIKRGEDGFYTIQSVLGKALDIPGGSRSIGSPIQTWDLNNTCAQKWAIIKNGSYFIIKSACSGNALDVVSGAIGQDNAPIQIYTPNGTDAQKWKLENMEEGVPTL